MLLMRKKWHQDYQNDQWIPVSTVTNVILALLSKDFPIAFEITFQAVSAKNYGNICFLNT